MSEDRWSELTDSISRASFGKTQLHYAVENGHTDIVKYLLSHYCDIRIGNNIFKTPVHVDTEIGDSVFEESAFVDSKLLKIVNQEDDSGRSPLYYAAEKQYWDIACRLILYGAKISALPEDMQKELLVFAAGRTNLSCAHEDHPFRPVVGLLATKVPDAVLHFDKEDDYPRLLSYFFLCGHMKVIDSLLSTIKDHNQRKRILERKDKFETQFDRVNRSDYLSDNDHLSLIIYLIENDAMKSSKNVDPVQKTLHSAARRGHLETFKYFKDYGDVQNFHTYMDTACVENRLNIVEYLWENYRVFTIGPRGNTPLHYAAERGGLQCVKYLCANGANVNSTNDKGQTPLHYAFEERRQDVITYLKGQGAITIVD